MTSKHHMASRLRSLRPRSRALLAGAALILGPALSTYAFLPHSLLGHPHSLRPVTPGTDVVTSTADDNSVGTLRSVLAAASPGDTVTFDPATFSTAQTIRLSLYELPISQNVTITGPGANKLTIVAGAGARVLNVTAGTVAISGLTLTGAALDPGDGGDISNAGTLTLRNCAVTDGLANTGGGILNSGTLTATGSTFSGDSTTAHGSGGAIKNTGSAAFTNCTFAQNTAASGGAIDDEGASSTTITSCTFSGNTASGSSGGSLYENGSSLTVASSLFAGSTGGDIVNAGTGTLTSGGSNLLSDASPSAFASAGSNDQYGVTAAQVGALGANGGSTQTCALQYGSPAIDADYSSLTVDQRGVSRPQGARNDIGAYEAVTLTAITVTPASPSIAKGLTKQFTATGTYSDGSTASITSTVMWSSAAPTVATINASGLATGVSVGSAGITATLNGITSSSDTLTVGAAAVQSIAVTGASASVLVGLTDQFTATAHYSDGTTADVTASAAWSSSVPSQATINASGLATGVAAGTDAITATLGGVTSNSATLTVNAPVVTAISVTGVSSSIAKGRTDQFTAIATYSNNTTADVSGSATWASSTAATAAISSAGLATGTAVGTTGITAALSGVTSNSVPLSVTPAVVSSVTISAASASVAPRSTDQFAATAHYSDNTTTNVTATATWNSDAAAVATINNAGLAAGVTDGMAHITAAFGSVTSSPLLLTVHTPATLIVTNALDDGSTGCLRSVLAASGPGDTVTFDPAVFATAQTITLTHGQMTIAQNVTVRGPGANLLTVSGNNASRIFSISSGTVALSGMTLKNGYVQYGYGGAIDNFGTLTITNCTVASSRAGYAGGGLFNEGGATAIIMGSTFSGNTTPYSGGGLENDGAMTLTNCTFAGNSTSASGEAGAIENDGTRARLTITSCTLSGNTSREGGGIYDDYGSLTVTGSLFTGNTSTDTSSGGDIESHFGTFTSGGSNLFGDPSPGVFYPVGAHDQFGVTVAQAKIGALANNGGPTPTCALLTGSPALDADYSSGSAADQRGFARPAGVRSDIGAYEFGASVGLTSIAVTAASPSVGVGATDQLTATATYSNGTTADVSSAATWSSDAAAVATISSTGLATGVAAGTAHISASFGGQTASIPLTVAVTATPIAYVLWNSADGQVQVRAVNSDATQTTLGTFGPYTDSGNAGVPGNTALWTATAISHAPDGTLRLLWQHPDGRAMLWRLSGSGTPLSYTGYGPYDDSTDLGVPGNTALWRAAGLSVGADGVTHLVWDHPDGRAMLWNVNADDTFTVIAGFGPYTDTINLGVPGNSVVWHVTGVANAPDGSFRLLWNHPDGRVMLWTVDAAGNPLQYAGYGPYTDSTDVGVPGNTALWKAAAVQVSADGDAHLLWDHPDGRSMLWDVDSALNPLAYAGFGPYTDTPISTDVWHGVGLALTPSGLPYVLWGNPDGRTVLWNVGADSSVNYSGIFEAASDSAGQPWLPTALSGD